MSFIEVPDRNAAEAARGVELYVPEEEGRAAGDEDPDYFLNTDLVGMVLLDVHDQDQRLGVVANVFEMPTQSLLEVKSEAGGEFHVPFVSAIIKEVRAEEKLILVDLPEGLTAVNDESDAS